MSNLTLNEYQEKALGTAIYPGQGSGLGLAYVALKMNGEAGELAEHVGKAMRDDGYVTGITGLRDYDRAEAPAGNIDTLTDARRALILKEIGDVLWYAAAAATELGVTLSEVAQGNLDKLADRKSRGALGGSGDNR